VLLATGAPEQVSGQSRPTAPPYAFRPCSSSDLRIYFATTRLNEGTTRSPNYGSKRHLDIGSGSTDYGYACLARPNTLGRTFNARSATELKSSIKANSDVWYQAPLVDVESIPEGDFVRKYREQCGNILIYVHGYDISFEEALKDFALIVDEFQRRNSKSNSQLFPVMFSWPSAGSTAEYSADVTNLDWSESYFRTFLVKMLQEKNPAATLDVIGHSMGNRYLVSFFGRYPDASVAGRVRNLFVASADVDFHTAEQFTSNMENQISGSMYVIVSDKDGPLMASQMLNGQPRLGRPLDPPANRPASKTGFSDMISGSFWMNVALNTSGILLKNGMNDFDAVRGWSAQYPGLEREFGNKSRLIDVTDIVTEDLGHGIAWPVIAGLLSDSTNLAPFYTYVVHKKPDRIILEQNGGKPLVLYNFLKVDTEPRQ
jgi:esterase/lipase superfamily enzyme